MKLAVIALGLTVLVAVVAAGRLSAQTSTSTTMNADGTQTTTVGAAPALNTAPVTTAAPTVLDVVEITRSVPMGTAAVTAFTVPAGEKLIVTDVLLTNTGTAATCGAAIDRAGAAAARSATTTGTTAGVAPLSPTAATTTTALAPVTTAGTVTQTDSTITGSLCAAPRTTTALPLTTGIEFTAGQTVQLMNLPDTTAAATGTPGAVGFHLRGILVSAA